MSHGVQPARSCSIPGGTGPGRCEPADARRASAPHPKRFSPGAVLAVEALFGLLGFPGMGWLFSGRATAGLCLVFASPVVLWVGIPIVLSLFPPTGLPVFGPLPMLAYLPVSTVCSSVALRVAMRRFEAESA